MFPFRLLRYAIDARNRLCEQQVVHYFIFIRCGSAQRAYSTNSRWKIINYYFGSPPPLHCSARLIINLSSRRRHIVDDFDLIGFEDSPGVFVSAYVFRLTIALRNTKLDLNNGWYIFGSASTLQPHEYTILSYVRRVRVTRGVLGRVQTTDNIIGKQK